MLSWHQGQGAPTSSVLAIHTLRGRQPFASLAGAAAAFAGHVV